MLPFVPRAQYRESPLSILRRASLGNFHPSPIRFAHAINSNLDHSLSMPGALARSSELSTALLGSLGLTRGEVELVRYARTGKAREDAIVWNGLRVPAGDLQFKLAKVCVSCFSEDGVSLSVWDHIASLTCCKHQVVLLDHCPCCSEPWSFAKGPMSCGCSVSLIAEKQHPCTKNAAELISRAIDNHDQDRILLLGDLIRVLTWCDKLSINRSRLHDAEVLAALADGNWPNKFGAAGVHPRLLLAPLFRSMFETSHKHARRMLSTWAELNPYDRSMPNIGLPKSTAERVLGLGRLSLNKLVEAGHLQRSSGRGIGVNGINKLLLRLGRGAAPSTDAISLPELRSGKHRISLTNVLDQIGAGAITNFAFEPAEGLTSLRCDWPAEPIKQQSQHITAKQLAATMKTNYESIRRLIKLGMIKARKGSENSAVEWVLDQNIAVGFCEKYIFASEAADKLGLPRNVAARRLMQLGIGPISGPGINGGITFLFRRQDIDFEGLHQALFALCDLPVWKCRRDTEEATKLMIPSHDVAKRFNISTRQVRDIVQQGWISPIAAKGRWAFYVRDVDELATQLDGGYISLDSAAKMLGQTRAEFQKTWIDTAHLTWRLFASKKFIAIEKFESARRMWRTRGSASSIGRDLKRPKWLAANLQKMGQVAAIDRIGSGRNQVHLFERAHPSYEKYDMT